MSDRFKSIFKFKINIDKSLQNFFIGVSDRISHIKTVIQEEREKQKKKIKIKIMEKEKMEAKKRLIQQEELALKTKTFELKEEG